MDNMVHLFHILYIAVHVLYAQHILKTKRLNRRERQITAETKHDCFTFHF